ncbi:ribonuclease HII [Gordonia sp. JH63]|uniref:ribonuclease HII n=1 Tax=Gordonia TaxID=2053 RepID=UPI00071DC8A2|nr:MULTISPECIES: ribonuclease HII [Gordonia]MBR7192116.1 ribonuclease HII [Gordonia sp. SCSIO 19800]MCT1352425.1 ribonuclease HII [Gordonia sp. p3-SID1431]MCX2752346.1 ribonuclease HII [Gordonia sp. 4N]MDT0220625.1 ribonuclease HII [Gordonia sp. AC31]OCH83366.1 ribonuclease HII [Gordonia sp. UCD-TK1]
MTTRWPPRSPVRRAAGLRTFEFALHRQGLGPVAGVDEAGRGACAGPLVVAACVLKPTQLVSLADLDDSKRLTERTREELYRSVTRYAQSWSAVIIEAAEIDRIGIHVANIEGMRRAVAALDVKPGYVLSDGFAVPGLTAPSLPVIGGDGAAACIAAASIIAKVTRDRIMVAMDDDLPGYDFAIHKGYSTALHMSRIDAAGPSPQHRMSYRNVAARVVTSANDNRDRLTG